MNAGNELRVLQIIKGLDIGGHNGGSENFGIRLARQLKKEGVSVALCAYFQYHTAAEDHWVNLLQNEGIPVVFANSTPRLSLAEGARTLAKFLQANPVDLVHSHFQVGTITCILLKIAGKSPVIIRTAHTPVEFGLSGMGWLARRIFIEGLYPLLMNAEIGVSQALVGSLDARWSARLIRKKAALIYNAIPEKQEQALPAEPLSERQDTPGKPGFIITMIGILNPAKNFDTAIRALPRIVQDLPSAMLLVIGRGPEENHLRSLAAELAVSEHVQFLGQVSEIQSILARSDLFLHPSTLEAMSTVILEAMQIGIPVVAADIPGNRELITNRENGLLFPPGHAADLARLVVEIGRNPETGRSLAEKASSRLAKFSLSKVSKQYQEIYRQVTTRT